MLHRYPVFSAMPSGKKSTPYNAFIDTLRSIKCYLHEDPEVLEVTLPKIIYIGNDRDGETSGLLSPLKASTLPSGTEVDTAPGKMTWKNTKEPCGSCLSVN